jgi:hypothetical protein
MFLSTLTFSSKFTDFLGFFVVLVVIGDRMPQRDVVGRGGGGGGGFCRLDPGNGLFCVITCPVEVVRGGGGGGGFCRFDPGGGLFCVITCPVEVVRGGGGCDRLNPDDIVVVFAVARGREGGGGGCGRVDPDDCVVVLAVVVEGAAVAKDEVVVAGSTRMVLFHLLRRRM